MGVAYWLSVDFFTQHSFYCHHQWYHRYKYFTWVKSAKEPVRQTCSTKILRLFMNLIYIQFHWQFLISYPGFWLINIPLWKLDTNSKKDAKIIKTIFLMKIIKTLLKSICLHIQVVFYFWKDPNCPRIANDVVLLFFTLKFQHIMHLILMFLLLNLNM